MQSPITTQKSLLDECLEATELAEKQKAKEAKVPAVSAPKPLTIEDMERLIPLMVQNDAPSIH